jgi:hypothetical protein
MYTLYREQYVTAMLSSAWDLLKNLANLDRITPPDLQFQIVSLVPEEMFNGLIIEYRIKNYMVWTVHMGSGNQAYQGNAFIC